MTNGSSPTTSPAKNDNTNDGNNQQPRKPVLDFDSLDLDDLMESIKTVHQAKYKDDNSVDICDEFNNLECSTPVPPKPPPGSLLSEIRAHPHQPTYATSRIST
jgi:hypothetical protein